MGKFELARLGALEETTYYEFLIYPAEMTC